MSAVAERFSRKNQAMGSILNSNDVQDLSVTEEGEVVFSNKRKGRLYDYQPCYNHLRFEHDQTTPRALTPTTGLPLKKRKLDFYDFQYDPPSDKNSNANGITG
jgi:hypothetical protein